MIPQLWYEEASVPSPLYYFCTALTTDIKTQNVHTANKTLGFVKPMQELWVYMDPQTLDEEARVLPPCYYR
jgi:hypothetical protein